MESPLLKWRKYSWQPAAPGLWSCIGALLLFSSSIDIHSLHSGCVRRGKEEIWFCFEKKYSWRESALCQNSARSTKKEKKRKIEIFTKWSTVNRANLPKWDISVCAAAVSHKIRCNPANNIVCQLLIYLIHMWNIFQRSYGAHQEKTVNLIKWEKYCLLGFDCKRLYW